MPFWYYGDKLTAQKMGVREAEATDLHHIFVFKQTTGAHAGQYSYLCHVEDKYVFSYLPRGAQVVEHGERDMKQDESGVWRMVLTWEPRRSNYVPADLTALAEALGRAKAEALLRLANHKEEE